MLTGRKDVRLAAAWASPLPEPSTPLSRKSRQGIEGLRRNRRESPSCHTCLLVRSLNSRHYGSKLPMSPVLQPSVVDVVVMRC